MANRLVTHAIRDRHGDILFICNPETEWRQRKSAWAISDIHSGRHNYFVSGSGGVNKRIFVVNGPHGAYLRTGHDQTEVNNLDDLPTVPMYPWEIAIENAEVLAVHAALTNRFLGEVILMGGDEHDRSNANSGEFHNTRLYNYLSNTIEEIGSPPADVFCCGHAFLPDGAWLVAGGTEEWNDPLIGENPTEEAEHDHHHDAHNIPQDHWSGARDCAIYRLGHWSETDPLLPEPGQEIRGGGRWYPTLITLGDGRVLAVGGHPLIGRVNDEGESDPEVNDGRHGNWLPEIFDPETNTWSHSPGHWLYVTWFNVSVAVELPEGQERPDESNNYLYYPRLFSVPGEWVFLGSPNDGSCGLYNPITGLIDRTFARPPHDGTDFHETNHTMVMLPLLPGDNYTPHFLFLGYEGPYRMTLNLEDDNEPIWEPTADRDWPEGVGPFRRHGIGTLLPTGQVIFTGGINDRHNDEIRNRDSAAVLEAEVYTPGINWETNTCNFESETWETTPPATVVRNYHSVALLLPNGLVMTAGSNINGSSGADDVKEYRIEMYIPWYDGDPDRPTQSVPNPQFQYGASVTVRSEQAHRIERIALMRYGSVTHAWDGDQRYIGIPFEVDLEEPDTLILQLPDNGWIAPPGPYMLWLIDENGRPSQRASVVSLR
ncbi:MAG: DUF1929 domain-containing protein [Bacteroidetes bacterium]|nr:DUF1929 domain-containing protein [Bacteroidota bacterium]